MPVLAVSSGDPAGIGLEIALKAWQLRHFRQIPAFFVLADPDMVAKTISLLKMDVRSAVVDIDAVEKKFDATFPIVALNNRQSAEPGQPSSKNAAGIVEAIERGVRFVHSKKACALVTCPIAKKILYDAGFHFPGHTEFLADLAAKLDGRPYKPVMMLAGPELKTVPVTVHIAIKEVPHSLTKELLVETGRIVARDLSEKFAIKTPRLAIAGLNPHAGEGGAMGHEEETVIKPAMDILRSEGIELIGPLPSDTMFNARARENYDAALCMYHDQALIPVKTIGFDDTVNVTLGLPFVRSSPDHGTAFDIAGKGIASPESFIAALKLADKLAKNTHQS
ncbi:4-hydroxythreonine-4-phosphate dehydrogenase PdxA [Bartonella sp. W8125]|uniref:4-hydroxythreonine-4-phosphate dehydrogenase PdxA n=1 Tax=Bartonella TaxID=773 RepID=UPI0018DB81DF|nr:4-hydroxythreonine-4-phosphate dehydrogenase PdxA [Bartonella choladocola]MBI0140354.1 4-hydroxythreonine-4-phosphate dehydrogenase PdxA [Bartonella choladocola]